MIPIAKPYFKEEYLKDAKNLILDSFYKGYDKISEFEEKFSDHLKVDHAISVSSGTSALHISLLANNIKEGDEIITTPFSFIATANCVLFCGSIPKFADIDPETFNIDPESVKEKITKKTKGIIGVHLYGLPCDIRALKEIAEDNELFFIEDACQAHNAEYQNKKVGNFGIANSFSFYRTKNMATGEGGMITTNDKEIAEKCKRLRNHGQDAQYRHIELGYNFRITPMSAIFGLIQLKNLDFMTEKRIEIANKYTKNLKDLYFLKTPKETNNSRHVYHQYTLTLDEDIDRQNLINHLEKEGIQARIYYPTPIHKQHLYQKLGYKESCPVAEDISKRVISLPIHPNLDDSDINKVIGSLKSYK